jgi:DNA polymerase-3 subunit beta
MKIQLLKENLQKTGQLVQKFTLSKGQLPVLEYVLIQARKEGITFLVTNLDVSVRLRVSGKILEEGEVLVRAKVLTDVVSHLPMGAIELSVADGQLVVSGSRGKVNLQTLSAEEFPVFSDSLPAVGDLLVQKAMEDLDSVGYSVSTDDSRPVLMGVLWQVKQGRLVATDGYRLSLVESYETWKLEGVDLGLIVPGKALIQAMQLFADLDTTSVRVGYDEKTAQLSFTAPEVGVLVRVMAGEYPGYEAIIPAGGNIVVKVDKGEFFEAVSAAQVLARDNAHIVKLAIESSGLTVSAASAQLGQGKLEVEAEVSLEMKGEIAFNCRYLLDFLNHCQGERVRMEFSDPLKPGLFQDEGNKAFKHVIMPVRVKD